MIDATDNKILSILRQDARTPAAEIARQVSMAPSAVFERIRKLEDRGIVKGYAPVIDPLSVGYGLLAFILVGAREGATGASVGLALSKIPGVQEVHHIAGSDDYLVKIRSASTEALGKTIRERFKAIPGLRGTRTTVVLETIKESAALDLPSAEPDTRAKPVSNASRAEPAPRANTAPRQARPLPSPIPIARPKARPAAV